MAIGFMRATECKVSASSQYDYITRNGKYRGKDDLIEAGSENMPDWAQRSPRRFWSTADRYEINKKVPTTDKEKKYLRSKCKSLIIALPKEMTDEQLKIYTKRVLKKMFPGHAYTYAIHRPRHGGKLTGIDNPHVHVMLCTRLIEQDRPNLPPNQYFLKGKKCKDGSITGGYRKDPSMRKQWLARMKVLYAQLMNEELKEIKRYRPATIVFKDKGGKSRHIGVKAVARIIKGQKSDYLQQYIDNQIAQTMHKYRQAVVDAQKTNAPPATDIDRLAVAFFHPTSLFNKQKRAKELLARRVSRMDKDDYGYNRDIEWAKEDAVEGVRPVLDMINHIKKWCIANKIDTSKMIVPSNHAKTLEELQKFDNYQKWKEKKENEEYERKSRGINTHKAKEKPSEAKIERPRAISKAKEPKKNDLSLHIHDSEKEKTPVIILPKKMGKGHGHGDGGR